MNKESFLAELDRCLSQLPEAERKKHLSFYSEMIDDMTEDGISQQEALDKLGSASAIAKGILEETPLPLLVKTKVKPKNGWNVLTVVLLILASPIWLPIACALFAVIIAVYAVIWSVVAAVFAVCLAFVLSGIALIASPFFMLPTGFMIMMVIGGGLICIGIGIFTLLAGIAAAKGMAKLTVLFAKSIKSLFIRKEV